jgi:(1->4)-alpha-D-glucan 1-alpha-D-glucosylmutase
LINSLLRHPEDGKIKLYVMSRALKFRKAHRSLFEQGDYVPLQVHGKLAKHVCAFARTTEGKAVVSVTARFFLRLATTHPPIGANVWKETSIILGDGLAPAEYQDVFTKKKVRTIKHGGVWTLPLGELFSHLTVALLERLS